MATKQLDLSVCCIKECDRPTVALGLCVNHWRRNKKYGSPVALKNHVGMFLGLSAEERFRLRVKVSDGCWGWQGSLSRCGYPVFRGEVGGVLYQRGHRFSYAFHRGEHPGDRLVCHTCDNPKCTNPDHLFLGTPKDNMVDKIAKGRLRVAKGEDAGAAKLSERQAAAILADARPYSAIAADYGVAMSTVGNIKNRDSWRHIEVEPAKAKRVSPRKGVSEKFTPEDIREIRSSAESGKALAQRFGCSPQTITDIRKRRSWAHVT